MNKFNDIIPENKIIELPFYIKNFSEYSNYIKAAFELTNGILSLDEFNVEEEDRHIKISIISKNTQTKFNLDKLKDNKLDQENLIRGLNRALTDIFYLGDERFYSVNSKVVPNGIGFISNRQKRHLLKAGLIGKHSSSLQKNQQINNLIESEHKKKIQSQKEIKKYPKNTERTESRKNIPESSKKLNYYESKIRIKNNLEIFNIIHYPDEQKYEIVEIAKKIAKKRGIPVFNKKEYQILANYYKPLINKIVKLGYKKQRNINLHMLLKNNNLEDNIKYIVLNEVQRSIQKSKIPWQIIIKILLFVLGLLFFLSKL